MCWWFSGAPALALWQFASMGFIPWAPPWLVVLIGLCPWINVLAILGCLLFLDARRALLSVLINVVVFGVIGHLVSVVARKASEKS